MKQKAKEDRGWARKHRPNEEKKSEARRKWENEGKRKRRGCGGGGGNRRIIKQLVNCKVMP